MALPPRMRGIARLARLLLSIVLACTLVFGCGATQALLWDSGLAYAVEDEGEGEGGESGGSDESGSGSGESGSETDPGSGGSGSDSGSDGSGSGGSGGSESGGSGSGGSGGGSGGSGSGTDGGSGGGAVVKPEAYITNVGIAISGTNTYLAASYGGSYSAGTIAAKGGTLEVDSITFWSDSSLQRNTHHVTWSVSDTSVAYIGADRVLHAVADGTVELTATIDGAYTKSGSPLKAVATIKVTGQQDASYVSRVTVIDSTGQPVEGVYVLEGDVSTLTDRFYASVEVTDPLTGKKTTYSTMDGSLSEQTDGALPDLEWSTGTPEVLYVDQATGQVRALLGGASELIAASYAGLGGTRVSGKATVRVINTSAEAEVWNPQGDLTVRVFYDLYPPEDRTNSDDPAIVTERTFTLGELQSMGAVRGAYTAIKGQSYMTITAEGVPLATILSAAGVNLDGVQSLEFGTADSYGQGVSWDYIYGSTHYYYPNIWNTEVATAGAVQVYPIMAWSSKAVTGGSTVADYEGMSEATRFRLVTGSTGPRDVNSNLQIMWIDTIYVRLEGAPAMGDGEGEGAGAGSADGEGGSTAEESGGDADNSGGEGNPSDGTADGEDVEESDGDPNGEDAAKDPESADETQEDPQEDPSAKDANIRASADDSDVASADTDADAPGIAQSSSTEEGAAGGRKFSVFQMLNVNDSETDEELDFESPLAPFVFPLLLGLLALGGADSLLWYRRQSAPTAPLLRA